MKEFVLLLAAVLVAAPSLFAQSVVVTSQQVTYTRPKPLADFKKTFTINYPKVKAATPALSRKIEAAVSFRSVLGLNLREELGEIQWLEEADHEVKYNKKGILAIELRMYGSAAYPSGVAKTVVVDLRTGTVLSAPRAFRDLSGLAALVETALRKEIDAAIEEIRNNPENEEQEPEELFAEKHFGVKDLESFSIDDRGVTFIYNYGFPHVVKALEPDGLFRFTWAELRPFIRPTGLLARFTR